MPACWCGNTALVPFSPDYVRCPACETLVALRIPGVELSRVTDDTQDFYGQAYWFSHQQCDLGQAGITTRIRTDLPERCLYWLRTLLQYKLPPATVLELGSAHGGFIAMLRGAGFEATGLELSPWVVAFSRQAFDVPILQGPIEDQRLACASLDAIVLMDVLEHFPHPVETMRRCLDLLKPDGILVIQTPCLPEGQTYDEMLAHGSRFLEQLKEQEHLYLFSQRAIRAFFAQLGAEHISFEPAIFAHYDMFLVVSRAPLTTYLPDESTRALLTTPGGRLIQAWIDLDDQRRSLQERYAAAEADRLARQADVERLEQLLAEAEQDRATRLGVIEAQGAEIARLYPQIQHWMAQSQAVQQRLQEAERDQVAQRALLQQYAEIMHQRDVALRQEAEALARLQAERDRLWQTLCTVSQARVYKLLRSLGRWETIAQTLSPLASPLSVEPRDHAASLPSCRLRRIAVDLTPLLPGGANGGAKVMVLTLLQHLSQAAPELDFVLLTSENNHAELAALDATNVRRFCMTQRQPQAQACQGLDALPEAMKADLLFCPFTAPFFFDPAIPVVSVVYDLQYLYYPQLFSPEVGQERDTHFRQAARCAKRLICISDYVRQTVLDNATVQPEDVTTIHIGLPRQTPPLALEQLSAVLESLGLKAGRFLLYPANFWPHKNHRMLLTAFKMYRTRYQGSDLELVCTGTPNAEMECLRDAVVHMQLAGAVSFPGYVSETVFAALLQACRALIFPSLYEGFGIPVLEAMACGKPVLCSQVTSLPEVAGDAALYFDPRKPAEIMRAIERIENDAALAAHLIPLGYERVQVLGGPLEMAQRYLQVFREVFRDFPYPSYTLHGLYADGWLGNRVRLSYNASQEQRTLELVLTLPREAPYAWVSAQIRHNGHLSPGPCILTGGKDEHIRLELSHQAGEIELLLAPAFQPVAHAMGEDRRTLSCLCTACRVVTGQDTEDLLTHRY